jgi:HK97 gp10 family phage protein
MGPTVKIDGLAEVQKKLRLLPQRVGNNAMRRALRKGGNVIRDQVRANARQLDDPETARSIAKNVVVQGGGRRREKQAGGPMMRVGVMGGAKSKRGKASGSGNPGGDTWYWRLLEFGTSKMRARPFFRNAIASSAQKAVSVIASAMLTETDKELRKIG